MANKTKLNRKMIAEIVALLKLRMTWTQIAKAVGVTVQTLQNWRNAGIQAREEDRRNIYRELVDAIDQARTALFKEYAGVIRNEILHGKETYTEKEIHHKDGSIVVEKITKKEPPNTTLGLKVLGMEMPEVWAEQQTVNVNWQDTLQAQGHDPDKVKAIVKAYLTERTAQESEDVTADDTA